MKTLLKYKGLYSYVDLKYSKEVRFKFIYSSCHLSPDFFTIYNKMELEQIKEKCKTIADLRKLNEEYLRLFHNDKSKLYRNFKTIK